VAPALEGLRDLRHTVLAGGEVPGRPTLAALLAEAREAFPTRRTGPEDPAFWLYTSGSTGAPKAAVHRQRDMVYVAETYLRQVLRLGPQDVSFSAAKLFFAYGLGNSLYFPLAAGCTAVIQPEPATARACFAVLERHRPTAFHAVPSVYHAMLRLLEAWREGREQPPPALPRLEHLRVCTSGGEPLPPAVLEGWRAACGVPILDGIGSTEALHFYVANRPGQVRPGSTGLPVPGYDVRVVDGAGRDAPPGEPGELWVRGGSVMARYWNRPGRTRRALRGGWLATGDRFRRDGDGFYWYEGRGDDLLKVGGSWVNPAEVEQALLTHPAVAEAAVVGRPDGAGLVQALACVVLRDGRAPDAALAESLRAHVAGRLAPFKVPARVEFRAGLPRTATGKLQRFRLREPEAGAAPAPVTA
jgi:benzoate-CoA ligase